MKPSPSNSCTPPRHTQEDIRPVEGPEADSDLARLCKALGHPIRVQILRLLLQKNACICGELVAELPVSQSTVSQHLKILKQAGLVSGQIDGPRVCYCASPAALRRLQSLIAHL